MQVQLWRCCFVSYRLNAFKVSQRLQKACVPSGEHRWRQSHCRHDSSSGKSRRKSIEHVLAVRGQGAIAVLTVRSHGKSIARWPYTLKV